MGSLVYSIRSQKSPELGLLWAKRVPAAHPHKSSLTPPPRLNMRPAAMLSLVYYSREIRNFRAISYTNFFVRVVPL